MQLATKPWQSRDGRLGILFAGIALWEAFVLLRLAAPFSASAELWRMVAACIAIFLVGVGLMFKLRIARCAAAALLALLAGIKLWGQIQTFRQFAVYQRDPWFEYTPPIVISLAASVAFTLLVVWPCVAMIASLVANKRIALRLTVRIVAAAWLVVAAKHVLEAVQMFDDFRGLGSDNELLHMVLGFSATPTGWVSLSTDDVVLVGFMGWPVWHAVVASICAGILVGPARLWPRLSTILLQLFGVLVGLAAISGSPAQFGDHVMVAVAVGATGILAYLVWWLRMEINTLPRQPAWSLAGNAR